MKQHIPKHRTHSDDTRSTSDPEHDGRWAKSRPEASYTSAPPPLKTSQPIETAMQSQPGPGPRLP
ncbi:unnamed protein product [Penicillium salamii]|nr:unnamed protein product [Penicillium salamii]